MTIDEAITHADLMSHNENESEGTRQFAVLCVKALHLEKQKEEENNLCVPETWKEHMKREYRETKERYEKLHRAVTQFHPPKSEYINNYPYCLHLWKPIDTEIPHPPMICV